MTPREKMLNRVRAMLNGEGRTEEEMMAFLAKARELMATYEIDESELNQLEQEKATIFRTDPKDPYEIKFWLAEFVGKFTRCRSFAGKDKIVSFAGLESDVIFATWLLDTLQRFVMRALREFQKQNTMKGVSNSNYMSTSFMSGCTARISQKLKELTVEYTMNELVLVELASKGIVLSKGRASHRQVHAEACAAGHKAGASARFDRHVGQGGTLRIR